jgi:hypothetical protein
VKQSFAKNREKQILFMEEKKRNGKGKHIREIETNLNKCWQ